MTVNELIQRLVMVANGSEDSGEKELWVEDTERNASPLKNLTEYEDSVTLETLE
jgi:hypothetical protein